MSLSTLVGLFFVTGGATTIGSIPVFFHHYFKKSQWNWWESFGGGVMVSASVFSLFLPAYQMIRKSHSSFFALPFGIIAGVLFIYLMALVIKKLTENVHHQRAYLFVFVMGLHNIPEGLAVGLDVGALGWKESLPLTVAIFIQNLPEGLASSMSFLVSGFNVKQALLANGVTAVIETASAFVGYGLLADSSLGLPFLFSFSGACMMSVVGREVLINFRNGEGARFSCQGFGAGLLVCAVLDLVL
jgi:ZIP family zinc transporter